MTAPAAPLPPARQEFSPDTQRMLAQYRQRIEAARVYDVARVSELMHAKRLSARLHHSVYLKREDQQPVHSFKLRGAFNKMVQLTDVARAKGVICASAGNHAQGVALAAAQLGCTAVICMPRTTPGIKVESVRALGGKVVLHGDAYDDAREHAEQLAADKGYTFVHPYDDAEVIAGQGTVALEVLQQLRHAPDVVFVCVGGGGLLAGVAAYIKAVHPSTRVVAVEPEDSDCFARAYEAGRRVTLSQVGLFADGVAVKQVGEEPWRVARHLVDEVLRVDVDEICAAIRDVFVECRTVPEPAGALALAGLKKWATQHPEQRGLRLVATVSGANINFDRLRFIAERTEVGDATEALLAVTIPEQPGSFRKLLKQLGRRVITEFNYRYQGQGDAHVFVGFKLAHAAETAELVAQLQALGYPVVDLSHDELAKTHIRHLVGGSAGKGPEAHEEHLFRFEFPERPGACLDFLNAIGTAFNISLFHYRNHGAAEGKVLVGLHVPRGQLGECRAALKALGYEHTEETQNPAYRLFLRG